MEREWHSGDILEVNFPFSLRLETMPDDENRIAVMYGPMVLAGDLGPEDDPYVSDPLYVPVLLTDDSNPEDWANPVAGKTNTFITTETGKPREIEFKPFYKIHNRRYSVYFDIFNQEKWNKLESEYIAKQEELKRMEAATVDFFQFGEMQPERDHNFLSEGSRVGTFKQKKYRSAVPDGWFSFEMGVNKQPVDLVFEFTGSLRGFSVFDIYADDFLIATEELSEGNTDFFHQRYEIPDDISTKSDKLQIKIVPKDGNSAGPVYTVRTVIK